MGTRKNGTFLIVEDSENAFSCIIFLINSKESYERTKSQQGPLTSRISFWRYSNHFLDTSRRFCFWKRRPILHFTVYEFYSTYNFSRISSIDYCSYILYSAWIVFAVQKKSHKIYDIFYILFKYCKNSFDKLSIRNIKPISKKQNRSSCFAIYF